MQDQTIELVESFFRCSKDGTFVDTFYDRLLAKGPEIWKVFAQTDFKLQKLMLRQSLLEMIAFDRGLSGTEEEVVRLGHRHKQMGITPEMYAMWIDSLCEAIREHDPEYTPAVEKFWRNAMQKPIDKMIAIAASDA